MAASVRRRSLSKSPKRDIVNIKFNSKAFNCIGPCSTIQSIRLISSWWFKWKRKCDEWKELNEKVNKEYSSRVWWRRRFLVLKWQCGKE